MKNFIFIIVKGKKECKGKSVIHLTTGVSWECFVI